MTVCASGLLTLEAMRAAQWLEGRGIECEVIDLRTLNPIDWGTILSSVSHTGRLIAVDSGAMTGSVAGEIVARVTTELFGHLRTAPIRLAQPDVPEPTSAALTKDFHVSSKSIAKAALRSMATDMPPEISELSVLGLHDVPGAWFSGPF